MGRLGGMLLRSGRVFSVRFCCTWATIILLHISLQFPLNVSALAQCLDVAVWDVLEACNERQHSVFVRFLLFGAHYWYSHSLDSP